LNICGAGESGSCCDASCENSLSEFHFSILLADQLRMLVAANHADNSIFQLRLSDVLFSCILRVQLRRGGSRRGSGYTEQGDIASSKTSRRIQVADCD
jgi:hypothetical protein